MAFRLPNQLPEGYGLSRHKVFRCRKTGLIFCASGGVTLILTYVRPFVVLVLLALCSAVQIPAVQIHGEEFYVSPKGADSNPGTKSRPFASLERARDAARAAKHEAPITIWLRGGDYRRTTTFALTSVDSGAAAAPVVYRAVPGERVRIIGGVPVGETLKKWRGEILRADLRAQGITNYGEIVSRGMGRPNIAALEFSFNGRPMTLARWPNTGWAYTDAATRDKAQNQFVYEGERAARWVKAPDAWVSTATGITTGPIITSASSRLTRRIMSSIPPRPILTMATGQDSAGR